MLRVLVTTIRQESVKSIKIGKEIIKLLLFAGGIIIYVENTKESTQKSPELINVFSKVARYKINITKSNCTSIH